MFDSLTNYGRNGFTQNAGLWNPLGTSSAGLSPLGSANPTGSSSLLSGIFGEGGWGVPAIQGLGLLSGIFGGMQQAKYAKQALNHTREMDRINLENQRKLTNASLEDRQKSRLAMQGSSQHRSVSDYMNSYGV